MSRKLLVMRIPVATRRTAAGVSLIFLDKHEELLTFRDLFGSSSPSNSHTNTSRDQLHLNCGSEINKMIRKLKSGEFRLYSRKKDAKTGKRKNLGTFSSLAAAKKHEKAVQYFKRAG
jgi:hypothetical protein